MSSTAGNLLLRAGMITSEQLAEARELSVQRGCPLSEALVGSGAIDESSLVEVLTRRLMIERMPSQRLHSISKSVLRTVSPDMAKEFRVVPVEFGDDGTLILAMADPTDTHAVDEVRFFADRFVVRTAALLSDIHHALAVHYGAHFEPPPGEESPLHSDLPIADEQEDEDTEAGEGNEHTNVDDPEPAPAPFPLAKALAEPITDPGLMPTMLNESPLMLTKVKRVAGQMVAPHALPEPAVPAAERPAVAPPLEVPPPELIPGPPTERMLNLFAIVANAKAAVAGKAASKLAEPVDPDEPILLTRMSRPVSRRTTLTGASAAFPALPLQLLRNATSRDQIASLMLDYVAQLCRRSLLMVIRRGYLEGFAARGDDAPRLAQISLPLDAPTLLRDVIVSRLPYRGPLPITEENDRFADVLGGVGTEVLVMPITIREKLIALLYADSPLRALPDTDLHTVTREVGLAFERLILEKRPG